jgi:hypothetical protein
VDEDRLAAAKALVDEVDGGRQLRLLDPLVFAVEPSKRQEPYPRALR